MNYRQAIEYINSMARFGSKPGLERIRVLLEMMGNPHKSLKYVHVAGTNGKGSTCAMIESVLRSAGYKTGLYISPYVEDYRERMQINREPIPEDTLAGLFTEARSLSDDMPDRPRKFEIETACALKYFADQGCEIVVLEVGMGGRLDATNIIDAPEVSVITSISYDHMQYLGDTIEKITFEKRGIIKPGSAVVETAGLPPASDIELSLQGSSFTYKDERFHIPLVGAHQVQNAVTAIEAVTALRLRGWRVPPDAISRGLETVRWPGRFEIVRAAPLCIVDGAHNIDAVSKLCESIDTLLQGRRIVTVMAMRPDKPVERCAAMLEKRSARFLRAALGDVGDAVREALSLAGPDGVVLACGSLHMIAAAKHAAGATCNNNP
jgi:dihydrofolate synthase/folylpolyglutamate synthase